MKEFVSVLKQTDKVTRGNIWTVLYGPFMGGLMGIVISSLSYWTEGVWCSVEVFLALVMTIFMFFMWSLFIFPMDFMQAVSMGKARKYLFPAHYILWLRNTFIGMLCIMGVCLVRDYIYLHVIDGFIYVNEDWFILTNPIFLVTILLCVPALILFLGGMRLFFGIEMYCGLLGIFVMAAVICSKWKEKYPDFTIVSRLEGAGGAPNMVLVCLLCLLVGGVMLGLSWLTLRKQRVIF